MPKFTVTHPETGRKVTIAGPTMPTEAELDEIFKQTANVAPPQAAQADGIGQTDGIIDVTAQGGDGLRTALKSGMSTAEAMDKGLVNNADDLDRAKWLRENFIHDTASAPTEAKETLLSVGRQFADNIPNARKGIADLVRPTLEGVGTVGGAIVGSGAAPVAGTLAGAGLGYAAGKGLADLIEGTSAEQTPAQLAVTSLKDIGTGAAMEMGGQALAPAASGLSDLVGKVAKPLLGKLSGVGPGAIDEAVKSGVKGRGGINPLASTTAFDNALRGNVTGDEIVDNARAALNSLKEQRATAYQTKLQEVAQSAAPIDLRPVKNETLDLMRKYNVKVDPTTGKLDTSRIAMGKTGRNDIKEVINTVAEWGQKAGDNTPLGLDTLKRQLDDFYSDSSQARAFVAQIRNKVKDTIVANVPAYDEMTKGYAEATKLIKDVEADLMMRKQGMSGRITADKTLRRLMSAMRDNFEMRRELVEILGAKGEQDLSGQIAGYTMNTAIPRGLAGTGPALAGQAAYAHFVNPSFWPVLAASSPRVQGEFLRMLGKGIGAAKSVSPQAVKAGVIGGEVLATDAMRGGSQQQ